MTNGEFEPRGCPTPGACSTADEIERLQRYVAERDHYRRQWSEGQAEIRRLRTELAAERERCAKVAERFSGVDIGVKIAAVIREGE